MSQKALFQGQRPRPQSPSFQPYVCRLRLSSTLSGHVGKVLTTQTPTSRIVRSKQLVRSFIYNQLIRFERHIYNGTRHSARLSRLLTAGTKSLFSLISGDGVGRSAAQSALEPSKQGSDVQDLGVSFVNQVQNMQQQQQLQQQLQTNAGPYEGVPVPSSCHLNNYLHSSGQCCDRKRSLWTSIPRRPLPRASTCPSLFHPHFVFLVATSRKP